MLDAILAAAETGGFFSILFSLVAVLIAIYSIWSSRQSERNHEELQTQELLLRYDENVMSWGAECISEIAKLETILTIPKPDDFEVIYKAALLRISALIDQGRMFIPNYDTGDGHGVDKHPAYQGHRQKVLDLLMAIYDWGMKNENQIDNDDYAGARHLFRLRREFVAEVVLLLDAKNRRETLQALSAR